MDRHLLKKIGWFLVAFLVVNFAINVLYLRVMSISRLDRAAEQLQAAGPRLQYLILGDSHSQRNFDPGVLPNAFNFSSVGENYIQTYYKLETVLQEGEKQIESVILPIDLHSFSSYRADDFRDSYFWVDYIDYLELGLLKNDLPGFMLLWLKGQLFPYSDGGKKNIFDFMTRGRQLDEMDRGLVGHGRDFCGKKNQEQSTRQRVAYHLEHQNNLEPVTVDYFRKMLELCNRHSITVYLIKCPVTMEYYLQASKFVDPESYYRQIGSTISEYEDVHVIDFQEAFFGKNHYFYDPDHLNKDGARTFSSMLHEALLALRSGPGNRELVGEADTAERSLDEIKNTGK